MLKLPGRVRKFLKKFMDSVKMKKVTMASAVAMFSLAASMGHASDIQNRSGLYMSGSYGSVDHDLQEAEDYAGVNLSSPKGSAITFGYRVNQYVAIETGYTDFGSADASDSYTEVYGPYYVAPGYSEEEEVVYSGKVDVSASSFRLGLVLTTNVWETVSAGLKLGFHNWDAEASGRMSADSTWYLIDDLSGQRIDSADFGDDYSESLSESMDGTDAYYGVTAGWRINNFLLSVDYTKYVMEDIEPTMASLTLGYDF